MARDAAAAMDRMYRNQRHIYDLTRQFYLVGRDRLESGEYQRDRLKILEGKRLEGRGGPGMVA